MTPDRSHSDTVGHVANKVRVEGGWPPSTLTSTFQNIALLTHFLSQRFFILFAFVQPSFLFFSVFFFFLNENFLKNLKLKIKLLISLPIHSCLFNTVQKSHSEKDITAASSRSD